MKDDTASCPNRPGRRRLLHPRLDVRGRALGAVAAVLGRWDARVLLLLVSHPGFEREEFAWVGTERLGGGNLCVSIYTGLTAESPYLRITEDEGGPERFLVSLYVGAADGEPPEDPFLVSGCAAREVATESLRMIASARSLGKSDRVVMVFKHESEAGGEPIGPAVVVPLSERGESQGVGVPFVPRCVCARPVGPPGGRCGRCGDQIGEPWMTLTQARDRARELGIELRET